MIVGHDDSPRRPAPRVFSFKLRLINITPTIRKGFGASATYKIDGGRPLDYLSRDDRRLLP